MAGNTERGCVTMHADLLVKYTRTIIDSLWVENCGHERGQLLDLQPLTAGQHDTVQ